MGQVLKFPVKRKMAMKMRRENRRFVVMGSILSIFVVTMFLNSQIAKMSPSTQDSVGRGLASADLSFHDEITIKAEHQLASRLAVAPKRSTASAAQNPSKLDNLLSNILEGKYSVRLTDGKVREIEFSDSFSSGDKPKYIRDLGAFLLSNQDIWAVRFTQYELMNGVSELEPVYVLKDHQAQAVGTLALRLDHMGRLLSIKFDKVQSL